MKDNHVYMLVVTMVFLGLCLFYGVGGCYEIKPVGNGGAVIKVNKFTGKSVILELDDDGVFKTIR